MTKRSWTVLAIPSVAAVVATMAVAPAAAAAGQTTWFVNASSGADSASCGTSSQPCKTIGQAVANAAAGDTVDVAAGTYAEQVTIAKKLAVAGPGIGHSDHATVAPPASVNNGFLLTGAAAAGSSVTGFFVQGAQGEGILAQQTSHVLIADNVVQNNDQGASNSSTTYGECQAHGPVPGDCGEGIHLMSVTSSHVEWNQVMQNSGGILLSDEMGPTAHNRIDHNVVVDNADDCGITVVGHNPNAFKNGTLQPNVAGVYANTVARNVSNDNGLSGKGAGVVLAGAGPGTAVYRNSVIGNTLHGNGLGGVTLHDHAPGQFMDGNHIIGNDFDGNDTAGGANGPGDEDTQGALTQSADVIIYSAADLVKFTLIANNTFTNAHYGIWTHNAPTIIAGNRFGGGIDVPVAQSPGPVRTTMVTPSKAPLGSVVTLRGKAEPSVPVTVRFRRPGHSWHLVGRTISTAKGTWTMRMKLRYVTEYLRASAYATTTARHTLRAG
jgi:hypothetical protein